VTRWKEDVMAIPHGMRSATAGWPQWAVIVVVLTLVLLAMLFVTG
jgi:hypothetical protein